MRKILLAFDGPHYSDAAMEFTRRLNASQPVLVTGAFMPQVDFTTLWTYSAGSEASGKFLPLTEPGDAHVIDDNILKFEEFCSNNRIRYKVHKDFYDLIIPSLKEESRFADLMILGSEKFYEQAGTDDLNAYLKEALHGFECPIIVVPEKFAWPESNIFTYDGNKDSLYAIKQFAYLFPEFTRNKTIILHVGKEEATKLPEEEKLRELIDCHFNEAEFVQLLAEHKQEYTAGYKTLMEYSGNT